MNFLIRKLQLFKAYIRNNKVLLSAFNAVHPTFEFLKPMFACIENYYDTDKYYVMAYRLEHLSGS